VNKLRSGAARALLFAALAVSAAFSGAKAGPADMHGDAMHTFATPVPKSVLSNISLATTTFGGNLKGTLKPECPIKPGRKLVVLQGGTVIGSAILGAAPAGALVPFQVNLTSKPTGPLTIGFESAGKRYFASSTLDSQLIRRNPLFPIGNVGTPNPNATATPTMHTEIIILEPCN
jgi:hypothetical protein